MRPYAFLRADEPILTELTESRDLRLTMESLGLLAFLACLSLYRLTGLPGSDMTFGIGALPLLFFAALIVVPAPKRYVLTDRRIAQVSDGRLVWSLRFNQITKIRRFGPSLYLKGNMRATYAIVNIPQAITLENHLWEAAS